MKNTENNVAAQAGDEPMRAARSIGTDRAFETAAKALHLAWTPEGVHALIAAADAFVAAQVSPRATADVERDAARWQFFDEHAQDVYAGKRVCEWIGFSGVMEHGSRDAAIDFLAAIATTKPGA